MKFIRLNSRRISRANGLTLECLGVSLDAARRFSVTPRRLGAEARPDKRDWVARYFEIALPQGSPFGIRSTRLCILAIHTTLLSGVTIQRGPPCSPQSPATIKKMLASSQKPGAHIYRTISVPHSPRISVQARIHSAAERVPLVCLPKRRSYVARVELPALSYTRMRKRRREARQFLRTPDAAYRNHPYPNKAVTLHGVRCGTGSFMTYVRNLHRMSTFGTARRRPNSTAEMIRGNQSWRQRRRSRSLRQSLLR